MNIPNTYPVTLAGFSVELPVCPVPNATGVYIAYLHLGNQPIELTEAIAEELSTLVPANAEVIVAPYGKALGLYDQMRKLTRLPGVVCPKQRTLDMVEEGYLSATAVSITTPAKHDFHLSKAGVALVRGKHVVVVDDIVSRGGTKNAIETLLLAAGVASITFIAVGTEGERRDDVRALHHFPVFLENA